MFKPRQVAMAASAQAIFRGMASGAAEGAALRHDRAVQIQAGLTRIPKAIVDYRSQLHSMIAVHRAPCTQPLFVGRTFNNARRLMLVLLHGLPVTMNNVREHSALNKRDVQRQFDRAAASFDGADFVHRVTRDGLIERLRPLRVEAETVLDLGAATGSTTRQLRHRFGGVRIVSLDLSHNMLRLARRKRRWFSRTAFVQADAEKLPFRDASFDVVFSNLLLPWLSDPANALAEVARVLRKDGVFVFATLGPDSLVQLSRAFFNDAATTEIYTQSNTLSLHDALPILRLADPVLDVDHTNRCS
jgi:ubiquinone/menaquinone biosynthesis C-methylase UbiE